MATPEFKLRGSDFVGIGVTATLMADLRDKEIHPALADGMQAAIYSASQMVATMCEEGGIDTSGKYGICVMAIGEKAVSANWDMELLIERLENDHPPEGFERADMWDLAIRFFNEEKAPQAMYSAFMLLGVPFMKERAEEARKAVGEVQFPVTIILAAYQELETEDEDHQVLCGGLAAVLPVPAAMLSAPKNEIVAPPEPEPSPPVRSPYVPKGFSIN